MKAIELFDAVVEKFQSENKRFRVKELTYGSNGYPEFGGKIRKAFYTDDPMTFKEIEELCDKYENGVLQMICWNDGQNFANVYDSFPTDLIRVSADTFGSDMSELYDSDSIFQQILSDQLDTEKETIGIRGMKELVDEMKERIDKAVEALDKCPDDSFVLANDSLDSFEIMKRETNYLYLDSTTTTLAIVFDSEDFEEDEDEVNEEDEEKYFCDSCCEHFATPKIVMDGDTCLSEVRVCPKCGESL